jgi:hypothetical protein
MPRNLPRRLRLACFLLAGLAMLPWLASCGNQQVNFHYPGEQIDFSLLQRPKPSIFIDLVRDLRPEAQRLGQGHFLGITYPSDEAWDKPVHQIYREALVQDLTQTQLVEVVPLARQADYVLTVDLISFGSRLQRSPVSFLLPLAGGMGVGLAVGEDTSDRLKTGMVVGVAALLAVPLPTSHRAGCEAKMQLQDRQGEVVWEQTCLGEVNDTVYVTATARSDQSLVDKFLTKAVKRCNACLLGQLRQILIYDEN